MSRFTLELAVSLSLILPFFFLGFILEVWIAADEENTTRNTVFNISHGLICQVLAVLAGNAFATKIGIVTQHIPRAGVFDLGISDHGHWWLAIPLTMLSLAIYDFFYYWFHRLQHSSRWLWAEHELHHSEEHVNVTTGVRHHQLELFLLPIFVMFPLGALFRLPRVTLLMAVLFKNAFVYFIHVNAKIGFGPLNRVLANPQVHRIHHSKSPQHIDKNFAAYFSFWDVLFGTYYHPKRGEYPATGLVSGRTVYSLWEAAAMPFATWAGMMKSRGTGDSAAAFNAPRT